MAMPKIPIDSTLLIDASAAASGSADVPNPQTFWINRFDTTITVACDVILEGSRDGALWLPLATTLTASQFTIIDRPFKYMRVRWENNTGLVTVGVEQFASNSLGML